MVLTYLWDLRGVLKGVKSSALEVWENQRKPGEISLVLVTGKSPKTA